MSTTTKPKRGNIVNLSSIEDNHPATSMKYINMELAALEDEDPSVHWIPVAPVRLQRYRNQHGEVRFMATMTVTRSRPAVQALSMAMPNTVTGD